MTYQKCVDYILSIPMFAEKLGMDNLNRILELCGHPEQCCPVIHVAGTNGKGSTCSFLMSILKQEGKRVGVFTSPHLIKINERIRINNEIIEDDEFVELFDETMGVVEIAKQNGIAHPSFFEFMFLMGALYFKKKKVDYVIYETGMGGRLDATNVVNPVLCIITSVGLDHMQFLGNTIEEIAQEKAGIIKKGVPTVFFDRKDDATPVIYNKCKKIGSNLHVVEKTQYKLSKITKKAIDFSFNSGYYEYDGLAIKKTALYQVENATLAIKAYEILHEKCGSCSFDFQNSDSENSVKDRYIDWIKAGLFDMDWPCRMQCVDEHIYIDGAHNEEAINAFCETLEVLFPTEQKILLFAVSKDKDYENMIGRLSRVPFEEIIIVQYEGSRAAQLETVEATFRRFSGSRITTFEDIREGFQYARSHVKDQFLFCVGSLYLAGDLLKFGV